MAIQNRRGKFGKFDPARMVPGEWAVVLDEDPAARDGRSVYICFAAGSVKRMATHEDMVENVATTIEGSITDIKARLTELVEATDAQIKAAEAERSTAEQGRVTAETKRAEAETGRAEAEAERSTAEAKRAAAEQERAAQQVKNNADQAANNAAAQGLQVVKLNEGQFDPDTLMPTVSGEVGKLYFVPIPSQAMSALAALVDVPAGDGQDDYLEWMSIDGKWERVSMSNATLVSLTTDEIDRIAAGEQVTSESVLGGTGLTYLWAKLKTAFAAITHKHATGDVTGLDTALADKATKGELKTVQDSLDSKNAIKLRDKTDYVSFDWKRGDDGQIRLSVYVGNVLVHSMMPNWGEQL